MTLCNVLLSGALLVPDIPEYVILKYIITQEFDSSRFVLGESAVWVLAIFASLNIGCVAVFFPYFQRNALKIVGGTFIGTNLTKCTKAGMSIEDIQKAQDFTGHTYSVTKHYSM